MFHRGSLTRSSSRPCSGNTSHISLSCAPWAHRPRSSLSTTGITDRGATPTRPIPDSPGRERLRVCTTIRVVVFWEGFSPPPSHKKAPEKIKFGVPGYFRGWGIQKSNLFSEKDGSSCPNEFFSISFGPKMVSPCMGTVPVTPPKSKRETCFGGKFGVDGYFRG